MIGDDGAIEIAVPRDRQGSFELQIVAKGQTRLDGFDDRIISLHARGLPVREIQAHLLERYGVEVSPDPGLRRGRLVWGCWLSRLVFDAALAVFVILGIGSLSTGWRRSTTASSGGDGLWIGRRSGPATARATPRGACHRARNIAPHPCIR